MNKQLANVMAAALAIALNSAVSADLIYDNGDPDGAGAFSNIFDGGFGADRQVADDFILKGGPGWIVRTVEMNYIWDTIGQGGATGFRITFYADDAGGGPGTIISDQESSDFTETLTGNILWDRPEIIYSVDVAPIVLAADTTYWVAIQPNGIENGFQLSSHTGFDAIVGSELYVRFPDVGDPDYVPGSRLFGEMYDVSFRLNGEAVPEKCHADFDDDGTVGVSDLLALLAAWGACANQNGCPEDLDDNSFVGLSDLLVLLANWGPCP